MYIAKRILWLRKSVCAQERICEIFPRTGVRQLPQRHTDFEGAGEMQEHI